MDFIIQVQQVVTSTDIRFSFMQGEESIQITMIGVAPMVSPFVVLKSQVTATSSERWGSVKWDYGKYAVKIYTIDGVMIYQADNGSDNTGKTPLGGVISQSSVASSMATTIANPITHYGGAVINQSGHSGDLYNYYWTSYSRGTDGRLNNSTNDPKWHNVYLDGYIPLRAKSIYDPCPYLYRIPSHGTWNQFRIQSGWTNNSYLSGASWNMTTLGESWFSGLGWRTGSSAFEYTGTLGFYRSSTVASQINGYALSFGAGAGIYPNRNDYPRSLNISVRCIEGTGRYAHTFCQQKVCKNCRAS